MGRHCVNRRAEVRFESFMDNISQDDYVRHVLTAYCQTPTTAGRANRQDRLLAARFYERHIPLDSSKMRSFLAPFAAYTATRTISRFRPYDPCITSPDLLKRCSVSRLIPKPGPPTFDTS